jgi:hypothetical protein
MVTFMGRTYKQPGAYSYTDPTALVGVGLGAGGVVTIIGTATGGAPGEVELFTDPVSAKEKHRGGNMMTAANYAWAAGANSIYLTRPGNPLRAALAVLNGVAATVFTVTSVDYGSWCNSIRVRVENATSGPVNYRLTIQYYNPDTGETTTEMGDELADGNAAIAYWAANYAAGMVTLTAGAGVATRPVNLVFTNLIGGDDDLTPTATEWQNAIDLYSKYETNIMHLAGVTDASTHALLSTHCTTLSNNRKERIGVVGGLKRNAPSESEATYVGNTSTPASLIGRAYNLNSDRMVLVGPGTDGLDACYTAAKIVGMLAGVDVATSLTHQTVSASSIDTLFTDSQKDNLITYGVCAVEEVPQGRRVLRAITTAQDLSATQEHPFKEISIRRIADYVNYNMRTNLETAYVGKKGVSGIESSIQATATSILVRLREAQIIEGFRNVLVKRDASNRQIVYVDYEVAPISPINWIFITTKLVPIV